MRISITVFLLLTVMVGSSQTAADYVSQGRLHLSSRDVISANNSFSNAVAIAPNDPTGNVFFAATRLLTLPYEPAGSNILNRLGLPGSGRDYSNWTAKPPVDASGIPLAPPTVNVHELSSHLRWSVLPALAAAEANLAKVTDTNFSLTLTSDETQTVDLTLDYADIVLLRALLFGAQYIAYTVHSWNLDLPLQTIRGFYVANKLPSAADLLRDYPQLFTFATTNDLLAAKNAFKNGATLYMQASQLIRDRSTNVTRLFNYDASQAVLESDFRMTLADLTNSLQTATPLTLSSNYITFLTDQSLNTNYSVFLGSHFSGRYPIRDFLPQFEDYGFGLGTLPDVTFGAAVTGITTEQIDDLLSENLFPIPTIASFTSVSNLDNFQFMIRVATNHFYTIQLSTNLSNWSDYHDFLGGASIYTFTDTNSAESHQRFYRVVDKGTLLTLGALERIRHSGIENSQYTFVVSNRTTLRISISRGSGDCDLYVKRGSPPSLTSWDYRPYLHGNEEQVFATSAQPDTWFIMLHGYKAFSRVKLYAW